MNIRFDVAPLTRCDIVAYSGVNLTGKRSAVRIFPSGGLQGAIRVGEFSSMVIRAPHGTRVILVTQPGEHWEQGPWRWVDMREGCTVPSKKAGGLPGVRLPDLDLLNEPDAKRTDTDFQASYTSVVGLDRGQGWTFGKLGRPKLKGSVRLIVVERSDAAQAVQLREAERLARVVLRRAHELAPETVPELARCASEALGDVERGRALEEWVEELLAE